MKHELIKTENYLLVVSDDQLNGMEWCYGNNINNDGKKDVHRALSTDIASQQLSDKEKHCKKIIAHLPLNGAPYLEGVDVLPEIEDEVDSLSHKWVFETNSHNWSNNDDSAGDNYGSFKAGYNKAKEIYKYTEKDIKKAIRFGFDVGFCSNSDNKSKRLGLSEGEFIQSLNQPKIPVAFECEIDITKHNMQFQTKYGIKTIINTVGRTEWVGTYIFNN